ncbi:MAG: PUR family DNA/RNA-binding protein [Bacteroidales bacterium]|nr:PUR family DNA/RNA-binding protein [Bacteroidales bacterium]MDE6147085.1 PUR family DNA/RNA-binding protein [Bacteroidales bacterium]
MYSEDYELANASDRSGEDVYSKPVRAGKRTYFFDVKSTKGKDFYLTITESKRKVDSYGNFAYDKHKIFLYKEDFEKFAEGLEEVIQYIKTNCLKDEAQESRKYTDVDFEEL